MTHAQYLRTLVAIRDAAAQKLLEAESSPDLMATFSLDGVSVSYGEYVAGLHARVKEYTRLVQEAGQPFTVVSRATT